ncbi:eukaryotic peptide chain release factor GTP-binding subunit ERF3A [Trifolium repens]|nr:eukaryotic peptide chain release factor GTP-binding subunit ERF3A [Trifolium repens]
MSTSRNSKTVVVDASTSSMVLELPYKAIFTVGYSSTLHIHSVEEECEIVELLQQTGPKTKEPMEKKVP